MAYSQQKISETLYFLHSLKLSSQVLTVGIPSVKRLKANRNNLDDDDVKEGSLMKPGLILFFFSLNIKG